MERLGSSTTLEVMRTGQLMRARLVQQTVGPAKEQTGRDQGELTSVFVGPDARRSIEHVVRLNGLLVTFHEAVIL